MAVSSLAEVKVTPRRNYSRPRRAAPGPTSGGKASVRLDGSGGRDRQVDAFRWSFWTVAPPGQLWAKYSPCSWGMARKDTRARRAGGRAVTNLDTSRTVNHRAYAELALFERTQGAARPSRRAGSRVPRRLDCLNRSGLGPGLAGQHGGSPAGRSSSTHTEQFSCPVGPMRGAGHRTRPFPSRKYATGTPPPPAAFWPESGTSSSASFGDAP